MNVGSRCQALVWGLTDWAENLPWISCWNGKEIIRHEKYPSQFRGDLANVEQKPGASPMMLAIKRGKPLTGEVSAHFKKAEPLGSLK